MFTHALVNIYKRACGVVSVIKKGNSMLGCRSIKEKRRSYVL